MLLRAEGISRRFFRNGKGTNYFTAVEKTDFTLSQGKLTAIMGRSGSGKTTFINMLAGLLIPSEGKVTLDDIDIYACGDTERSLIRNKHIGIIPQGHTGLQSLTVLENVLAPSMMYGKGKDNTDKALKLLESMGIAELSQVYSNELSGGELRRMSIARALINTPEIIIADEPTSDLDSDSTQLVMEHLKKLADSGAAVLIVTHDEQAAGYADIVLNMDNGKLLST